MANHKSLAFFVVACFLVVNLNTYNAEEEGRQEYVVGLIDPPKGPSFHLSLLKDIVPPSYLAKSITTSFRSINGFIANLTDHEAQRLARNKEVLVVFVLPLPDFVLIQSIGLDGQKYLEQEEGSPLAA